MLLRRIAVKDVLMRPNVEAQGRVRLERSVGRYCRDERETFRVSDRFNGQIHIQLRPKQMILAWPFDGGQLFDGGLPEPRELRKRQEKLFIAKKQPETVY